MLVDRIIVTEYPNGTRRCTKVVGVDIQTPPVLCDDGDDEEEDFDYERFLLEALQG